MDFITIGAGNFHPNAVSHLKLSELLLCVYKCVYCIHLCQCVNACNSTAMRQMSRSIPVAHTSTYWSTLEVEGGVEKRFGSQRVTWKVRRRG